MPEARRAPLADTGFCPHGNSQAECAECRQERLEPGLKGREAMQRDREFSGQNEEFAPDISVGYAMAMGKYRYREAGGGEYGQDMVLADGESGLLAVADGLGGEGAKEAGSLASAYAAERLPSLYDQTARRLAASGETDKIAAALIGVKTELEGVSEAEEWWKRQPHPAKIVALRLFEAVRLLSDEVGGTGGKTTLVGGKTVRDEDGRLYEVVVSVGDSLALKQKADGGVEQVNVEDSALGFLQCKGLLPRENPTDSEVLLATKGKFKSVKSLAGAMSQSLGSGPVLPHIAVVPVEEGDRMIYASDGLPKGFKTDNGRLSLAKLRAAIAPERSSGEIALGIVKAARSGQRAKKDMDDLAVAVKEFVSSGEIVG
jgi:serine/threonine protein phosphatase PrpC